ncbi:MAG: hypothetical protein ABEJ79_10440 [Halolamina sp.]
MVIFSAGDLAQTYDPPTYADPTEQLQNYDRVQEYASRHPNAGRTKVGNALDLPASRVRGWMNGVMPDAVRAVDAARDQGWVDCSPNTERGRAMATCVAAVFACGSVSSDWYRPSWAPSTRGAYHRLSGALELLHCDVGRRHADSSDRPTELVLRGHETVFGRCLACAGAPTGDKEAATVEPLPEWLLDASLQTRLTAAELYLLERATTYEDKATVMVQTGNRSDEFRASLGRLFRGLTDEEVSVGTNIVLSAAAARDLGTGPDQRLRQQ